MARRLPIGPQISKLQDRFCKQNVKECGTGVIDWKYVVDQSLTYSENLGVLQSQYPQYDWEEPEKVPARAYEEMVIEGLREEAEPYGYDIIKEYKIEALQRDSRRAERLGKKLEECQDLPRRLPSRPGVCRTKRVHVDSHWRCLPRINK